MSEGLFCFSGSVRRFARSRNAVTQLKGCWTRRWRDVGKTRQQRFKGRSTIIHRRYHVSRALATLCLRNVASNMKSALFQCSTPT